MRKVYQDLDIELEVAARDGPVMDKTIELKLRDIIK